MVGKYKSLAALAALVIVCAATTAAAFTLRLRFTTSPGATGYQVLVRQQGATPWVIIDLGLPPTTTPGIHDKDQPATLTPGLIEAAVQAYNPAGMSALSNIVTAIVPTETAPPTPTATATATATVTNTGFPLVTPTLMPPILKGCAVGP